MYAHIDGILAEKSADALVLDANGIGYYLLVSAQTLEQAPSVGERMKCYTILNVREDALELFGFATREEKHMFEKLRGVSGVGPRSAMQILSAMPLRDLSIALVTGDAQALTRAPGIGKKTAQRLVLELRDKVENDELVGVPSATPVARASGAVSDAIEAMIQLGYPASNAAKAVASVQDQSDRADELIRLALKSMGS